MYPRLALLHQFLREDGVIFASIDEVEFANLRFLFDEIFGITNRVGTIIWDNATDNNPTNIAIEHEYVICYAKNKARLAPEWKSQNLEVKERLLQIGNDFVKRFPDQEKRQEAYTKWFRENRSQLWPFEDYKFIDALGIFTGMRSVHNPGKEGYRYDVIHPTTKKPCKQPMMGYRFPQETMERLLTENRVIFGEDETKLIELKVYVRDYRAKLSSLFTLDGRVGTNEIKTIFPNNNRPFDFPKPTALIEELVSFTTAEDDLVLDSFAGSGTTAHAVLKLNKQDGQRRRFVLVEMKREIAREIAAERVRRVINGYTNGKGEFVDGIGGGFRYCELGEPLFDERGNIRTTVSFADLARHVYFTETGEPLSVATPPNSPLLGINNGIAVYLLYNGILKDKSPRGGNVLTTSLLAGLPIHQGPKVIYGTACRMDQERLRREGIVFKQLPYKLKVGGA
ncbi:MAG: site-specific DNA-methyltransferase, partial [Desulfobacterales bacterium]|nr:site-specific DNA-methyltransferase [Desulfobacterales bacterium]